MWFFFLINKSANLWLRCVLKFQGTETRLFLELIIVWKHVLESYSISAMDQQIRYISRTWKGMNLSYPSSSSCY